MTLEFLERLYLEYTWYVIISGVIHRDCENLESVQSSPAKVAVEEITITQYGATRTHVCNADAKNNNRGAREYNKTNRKKSRQATID